MARGAPGGAKAQRIHTIDELSGGPERRSPLCDLERDGAEADEPDVGEKTNGACAAHRGGTVEAQKVEEADNDEHEEFDLFA